MRRAALLSLVVLLGCSDPPEPPAPTPTPTPHQPAEETSGHVTPGDPPPARLVRITGEVTVGGVTARPATPLDAEVPIEVQEGGRAVIQLRDGGRVELDGPSRARLVEGLAAQLLLVHGSLYAVQPPAASSPRPPLRVVSETAAVEIGQTGEIYLAHFENGASWVATLQGAASVSVGEADSRHRLRLVELHAAQAVVITDRIAEPTEGPGRLTAARDAARALAPGLMAPEAPQPETSLRGEEERVDQALRWLEQETRRGRELTNQHRDAVRAGEQEDAQRLMRELVGHSQALYRLRRVATARWELLRTAHLRVVSLGRAQREDPVAERQDRVAGLLGH